MENLAIMLGIFGALLGVFFVIAWIAEEIGRDM